MNKLALLVKNMDFSKLPIGFAMELAVNEKAMKNYSSMNADQKNTILAKAHNVRSRMEMKNLVTQIGKGML